VTLRAFVFAVGCCGFATGTEVHFSLGQPKLEGCSGTVDESIYSEPADNGSNFRIDSCQYVYNMSASALGVGTYEVDILINGQVVGSATFALRSPGAVRLNPHGRACTPMRAAFYRKTDRRAEDCAPYLLRPMIFASWLS